MNATTKYEKQSLIGRGPECEVFRGRNRDIDVPVAIKELPDELRRNVNRRERYFAEAAIGAKLRHDRITAVLDVDRSQGWIVYDLMAGSLAEPINARAMPADRVEQALRDCLEGLDPIHRQGFVHANLKPANLLVVSQQPGSQQRVKLSDGRYLRPESEGEMPAPRGSHKYMAPELLDDSFGAVGSGIDIYAAGLMMIELLLGPDFDRQFRGIVQEVSDVEKGWVRWHTSREEEPIVTAELAPGTPPRLATVLDRMVDKDQLQRYRSVAEILDDLDGGHRQNSEPTASKSANHQIADAPTPQPSTAPPATPPARPAAPQPAKSAAGPAATPFEIGPLPPWPDTSVVLRHASGARAGEFLGISTSRITVGSGLTCDLSFLEDDHPHLEELAAEIQREAGGWVLRRIATHPIVVNQDVVKQETTLRSGDVIRLTPTGPDFQFLIQAHNQKTLKSILAEHAPQALAKAQAAGKKKPPLQHVPNKPTAPAAPVAPKAVSTVNPDATSIAAAPTAPAGHVVATPDSGRFPGANKFVELYQANRQHAKWILAIAGVLIAALAILLYPVGPADPPAPTAEQPPANLPAPGPESPNSPQTER